MAGVTVKIGANTAELESAVRKSKSQLGQLSTEFKEVAAKAAKMGAAAIAAGAALVFGLTKQGLAAVDAQAKLARGLGGTVDAVNALERAAGRAGVQSGELRSATLRLNQSLGEAASKGGVAKDSLDFLGLSARNLSSMDIDERMATIADRFQEMGLNSQETAFHLRNLGIRQASIVNLMQAGGDEIRRSKQAIKDFGLELSVLDTTKVESANDAFADVGISLSAVSQTLAVEMAPVLETVSRMFTDTVKEAGGLSDATATASNAIIDSMAFVMDAVGGVGRVFEVLGKSAALVGLNIAETMINAAAVIINGPVEAINLLVEQMNRIPNVDISPVGLSSLGQSIATELAITRAAIDVANEDIRATLLRPLPGTTFERYVAETIKAAEVAAEEMEAAGVADLLNPTGGSAADTDTAMVDSIRSRMNERLEAIREGNLSELELLREKHQLEQAEINAARAQGLIGEEEFAALMVDSRQRQKDSMIALERSEAAARLAIASRIFGDLAGLMSSGSRKMFEIGKAAALANAGVLGVESAIAAWKSGMIEGGPWIAAAYTAGSIAKTAGMISSIKSQSFGGGGSSGSAGGAGGTPSIPTGAQQQAPQPQQNQVVSINLEGEIFGRDQVRGLIGQINDALDDGYTLRT